MNEVKRMVRDLKGAHGITQKQIASEIGVNETNVMRWMTGVSSPQPRNMAALQAFYEKHMGTVEADEPSKGDRNSTIVAMHRRGYPHPEIGEIFGISRERVRKIVEANGEEPRRR